MTYSSQITIGCFVFVCTCLALAEETSPDQRKHHQGKLSVFNDYVGSWRGVGQVKRGSTKGAWTEHSDWAWKFAKDHAAIVFQAPEGKFFQSAELRATTEAKTFELMGTLPDEKTKITYQGKIDDQGKLILVAKDFKGNSPDRITIRTVADGKRLLILYEKELSGTDRYTRLAEVGYTRKGSGFGKGPSFPECVVTGGYGNISVTHNGETYRVCCQGCKDLFLTDPDGVLAEYKERKEKERQEAEK